MISNQHFTKVSTSYLRVVKMRYQARAACKNIFYFVLINSDLFSQPMEPWKAKIAVKHFLFCYPVAEVISPCFLLA